MGQSAENPCSQLHSRYNPQAEAVRFIDSLQLKETIECFILIEPGLGYIIPVLQERFKNSKIIVLHVKNHQIKHNFVPQKAILHTTERQNVKKFLETEVPEIEIDKIRIIEWRPSLNYFKEKYISLLSQVVEFLKQMDAGKRTTAAYGKRWFKNFYKNLLITNRTLLYRQTSLPVIVTGSGPNLEHALPLIAKMQKNCLIIAASSSIMALNANGITADLIITTDGGNWALFHGATCQRMAKETAFAVNLCAALPSSTTAPFLIINDGSFWQSIIFNELKIPSVIIPQRGTVTATAVELVMLLSSGNIFLAGFDFSNNDIRTHVKPYSFDNLFFGKANRFLPFYTTSFTRSTLLREGGSLNIYETWFKDKISLWQNRVFSLTEHKVFKNAIPDKQSNIKNINEIFSTVNIKNNPADSQKKGFNALLSALYNQEYSENIRSELSQMLCPGEKEITKQELEAVIRRELAISN